MADIEIKTGKVELNKATKRYVSKTVSALEQYLPRSDRDEMTAKVALMRVDRDHGNKYEATVALTIHGKTYEATDSTLNVLAALDIVRAKLTPELKKLAKNR